MFRQKTWLPGLILLLLLAWAALAQAQTAAPTPQPPPTPAPTEPPAILVVQPTPVPTPALQGNLWRQLQQVFDQNRGAILLAFIMGVVGVIVGVFIQRGAGKLADAAGKLFHLLFDRFATAPLIRLRYEKEYRKALIENIRRLPGGDLVHRKMDLEEMYVPALLTEETRTELQGKRKDFFRTRDDIRRRQLKQKVGPWEAVERYSRFVVLGAPGIGKTTYLCHLAFKCAQRERLENYTPIFMRFRDKAVALEKLARLEEIFPALFVDYNFPNAGSFIDRRLKEGRCLILLDGLDEVSDARRHARMIELVQEFDQRHISDAPGGNILVVSSRKHGYIHGQQIRGFPKTEVLEFEDPDVERFIYNWYRRENSSGADLAQSLLVELQGNRRFLELARNPLLLLLITDYYERRRNLPRQRAGLYRHCIRTRLIEWNRMRGVHYPAFDDEIKERMLRKLALRLFDDEEGMIWKADLLAWLETFKIEQRLPEEKKPEMLLEDVARSSGLLYEWAIDRYGFSHRTLQEFFAADAARQMGAAEGAALLARQVDNPAWKEVILLYCGLADNAQPLLQRILGHGRQSGARKAVWLLAGQCMAEGAQQITDETRRELAGRLVGYLRGAFKPALTPEESEQAIENLRFFAADWLPRYAAELLESPADADALLAARLLPQDAAPYLRRDIDARLVTLSRSADAAVRQAAVAALGRTGDAAAADALLAGLEDPDAAARAEAALALGRLGQVDDAATTALRRLYAEDPADAPRHAALEALLALGQAEALDMVPVPAGEFLMGSTDQDREADSDEKPQHRVYLPAYFIDRTPVTNAQYARFMAAGGYANPAYWQEAQAAGRWKDGKILDPYNNNKPTDRPRFWDDKKWNQPEYPVVGVSWWEALAYARWAGKRLPTEAEWEKAARGTDGRLYPWGSDWDAARANTEESGRQQTTPVEQYAQDGASPCNAIDMVGNVFEWCSTRWRDEKKKDYPYPYTPDDGREELRGGDDVWRVARGGSWYTDKKWARCAARYRYNPWIRPNNGGLRCCATSSLSSSGSES